MRVSIKGKEKNIYKEYVYRLFDRYDEKTKTSSMARTTGYTGTAAAKLILDNKFNRKGICPPEFIGAQENCYKLIDEYLKARNIVYLKEENILS
jgi:saccharopine dehydrogenase-like NADP-dependent oxidoreductase